MNSTGLTFQAANPQYEERIRRKLERQYFMQHLGISLSSIEPGRVEARVSLEKHHQQQDGFIHGGLTATLADVSTGFAAFSLARADQRVVTAELNISFFKPGKGTSVLARGWVVKPGSRLYFCESEVWCVDATGTFTLMAKAHAIMAAFVPSEKALNENGQPS